VGRKIDRASGVFHFRGGGIHPRKRLRNILYRLHCITPPSTIIKKPATMSPSLASPKRKRTNKHAKTESDLGQIRTDHRCLLDLTLRHDGITSTTPCEAQFGGISLDIQDLQSYQFLMLTHIYTDYARGGMHSGGFGVS
jgi:hypothetical protein